MKKKLSIIIGLSCLIYVSCGNITSAENDSVNNQHESTIATDVNATSDSKTASEEPSSSEHAIDSEQSDNEAYHLTYLGYFNGEDYPYQSDITDKDKREKIDELIAEINSTKDEYIYDKTGVPERGGSFGYSLTVDGVKYNISDLHDDPDSEFLYENLTIGDVEYRMPQELIDELVELLAEEFVDGENCKTFKDYIDDGYEW